MRKLALTKAYKKAYRLTMEKIAAGEWNFFNPIQRLFGSGQPQPIEDPLVRQRQAQAELRQQAASRVVSTPPAAPAAAQGVEQAAGNVAKSVEGGVAGAAENAGKAATGAAENVGKTVAKRGRFGGLGGKLKLLGGIATIAMPVVSHLMGSADDGKPQPEYAQNRYF